MKDESTIIYDYEQILTGQMLTGLKMNGKHKNFTKDPLFEGSTEAKRKAGGLIWRYAIEHILHWTPEQALDSLNRKIVKALKLDKVLALMEIEYGNTFYLDYREVLSYAFPEKIHYDVAEEAKLEYKKVMKLDEYSNSKRKYKFHKGFFYGENGPERARAVFNYALERYIADLDDQELYKFFGSEEALNWCNGYRLGSHDIPGYKDPLQLLHYCLSSGDADDLLYANERLRMFINSAETATNPE